MSESVKAAAGKRLPFFIGLPERFRVFLRGENGFYTFYTFYNVEKEVLIYSTCILQTFYNFLQNGEKHKTFYKILQFLQYFYNCRNLYFS